MPYLETLTKLNRLAAAKPAYFAELWTAACLAQVKSWNFNRVAAREFDAIVLQPERQPYSADERTLEDSLNAVLVNVLKDGGATSDRQFYKVLSWLESDEVGAKVLEKIKLDSPAIVNVMPELMP